MTNELTEARLQKTTMSLYGMPIEPRKFTLWEKIRLFFTKPIVCTDEGKYGKTKVILKKLDNKVYVTEVK